MSKILCVCLSATVQKTILFDSLGIDWKVYDNINLSDKDVKRDGFNKFKTPFLVLGMCLKMLKS